jgi:hypothetical protein
MKLVVCFSISDGYTWSQDCTIPVECESQEKLLCDFEEEVMRAASAYKSEKYSDSTIRFFDQEWTLSYFYSLELNKPVDIEIFTLEEWFEKTKVN